MNDTNKAYGDVFGRLAPAESGELNTTQQQLADQLHRLAVPFARRAGFQSTDEHGWLIGPWNAQVHRPEIADGYNAWVAADQAHSRLAPEVREVAILACAVSTHSEYEIYAHSAAAIAAGISRTVVDALRDETPATEMTVEQTAAREFATELTQSFTVSDSTYARTRATFGQDALIDLTHLVAIYIATAALLGAFTVGAPREQPPPFFC